MAAQIPSISALFQQIHSGRKMFKKFLAYTLLHGKGWSTLNKIGEITYNYRLKGHDRFDIV